MALFAELNRSMRGIQLTPEDEVVLHVAGLGDAHEYANAISDRNDAAIMLARTALADRGCRATRDRAMPAA